jgi:hypothetical protein
MTPDVSLRFEGLPPGTLRQPGHVVAPRVSPLDPLRRELGRELRIGIVRNRKARLNVARHGLDHGLDANCIAPRSHAELDAALADFAAEGVNALVINGGDGTVRDVLTAAARHFATPLRVAVLPSGKTNALATDLRLPHGWTEQDAVAALRAGRTVERSPMRITRADGAELHGFILGAGAFVRATALAQRTHRFGAFNGLAVGLSVAGGVAQTLFGGAASVWRQGTPMRIVLPHGRADEAAKYMLFASTLERLPLGIRPFGEPRPGLKLLSIDAHPRLLAARLPALLGGQALPADGGYRRDDADTVELAIDGEFVLDGETFPGGEMTLSRAPAIGFAVP